MNLTPHSPDAEKAVLGSLMLDPDAIVMVSDTLKPDHFYKEGHRTLFKTILSLWEEGQATDSVTVTERSRQRGTLDEVGGITYITGLLYENPGAYLIEQHVSALRETFRLRALQQLARSIEGYVNGGKESAEILHMAEEKTSLLANEASDGRPLATIYMEEAESILSERMGGYIQTGFYNLDRMLGGLKAGGVIVLAARPSSGKSSVARDIVRNVLKQNKQVALLSPDQSGADIFRLEASLRSGVPLTTIKGRKYTLPEAEAWRSALRSYKTEIEERLLIDDRPLTLPSLVSRFRNAVSNGADLVVIDYMQLIDVPGLKASEEYSAVTAVTKAIKRLARECGVPALALAQLNRGSEGRANPRPIMSDLRSSGQIEQDADAILFIHRPHKEEPDPFEPVEFIIAKQKDGPTGICHLTFKREFSTFLDA